MNFMPSVPEDIIAKFTPVEMISGNGGIVKIGSIEFARIIPPLYLERDGGYFKCDNKSNQYKIICNKVSFYYPTLESALEFVRESCEGYYRTFTPNNSEVKVKIEII